MFLDELEDDVIHLKLVLQTLKPDWLQVKVLHNLLDMYDDYLLPPNQLDIDPPLELTRIVRLYFFMLPPLKQEECASAHKKSRSTLSNTLRLVKVCQYLPCGYVMFSVVSVCGFVLCFCLFRL